MAEEIDRSFSWLSLGVFPFRSRTPYLAPAPWGRDDALVELLLLAECNALIRYPPASFFSFLCSGDETVGQTTTRDRV